MKLRVSAVLLLALTTLPAWSAGGLDTTFGIGGQVLLGPNIASIVAITQADGKIVVVGNTVAAAPNNSDLLIMRLLNSGAADTSFGSGGMVQLARVVGGGAVRALRTATVQPDGRILISFCTPASTAPSAACVGAVLRLNADGSRDSSFAANGLLYDPSRVGAVLEALAVQADGRIVGVGSGTAPASPGTGADLLILRITSTGALDASFGKQGIDFLDWKQRNDTAVDVALQSDGRILVVGVVGDLGAQGYGHTKMAVLRLSTDGALDPTFGAAGWWVYSPNGYDATTHRIQVLADDRILVAGVGESDPYESDSYAGVLRLSADGVYDSSYGQPASPLQLTDTLWSELGGLTPMEAQPDGSAWLVAMGGVAGLQLARLQPNGILDPTVQRGAGFTGYLSVDVGMIAGSGLSAHDPSNILVDPSTILAAAENRLVIAGTASVTGVSVGFVARSRPDDPPAGTVSIDPPFNLQSGTQSATAAQTAHLLVHRLGGRQGSVSVHYQTLDGQALAGRDYKVTAGQLDWADGDSSDRQIDVAVLGQAYPAGTYLNFYVRLTPVQGAIALGTSVATVQYNTAPAATPATLPASGLPPSGGGGSFNGWSLVLLLAALSLSKALSEDSGFERRQSSSA